MTSIAQHNTYTDGFLGWALPTSHGVSRESLRLVNKNNEAKQHQLELARETPLLRAQSAVAPLNDLFKECYAANWDGRGAAPISYLVVDEALELIAKIPVKYPMPEIIPEADGGVGLEWYVDPYRVLLLSVAGDGYVYYSGLFGFKNTDHGSKPLAGQLDQKIIELLEGVYR